MSISLTVHENGCAPLAPCRACRAVRVLSVASRYQAIFGQLNEAVANNGFDTDAHKDGCSPANPCSNCRFMRELEKVNADDRVSFLKLLNGEEPSQPLSVEDVRSRELLSKPLDGIEWNIRTANCLRNLKLVTLADLCSKNETELLRMPNFGRQSLKEVKYVLRSMGLSLAMDVPQELLSP